MPISSPHLRGPASVRQVMLNVVYALIPAIAAQIWLFGWGVITNLIIAVVVALGSEALMVRLRNRPVTPVLQDGSALVTAVLLAIALPPMSPWWLIVVGVAFAMVFAKHLYGGIGYNPFNPAMVGYVMLLISFPLEMTTWLAPGGLRIESLGLAETLGYVFGDGLAGSAQMDALTMATPLDAMRTQIGQAQPVGEIMQGPIFGLLGGQGFEVVNGLILLGGLWLIYKKIITWHVPVGLLGTLFLMALVFQWVNPDRYADPLFHLFSGGALLGAFFIATDPVSGCTSLRGRLLFGAMAGVLIYIIRTWGGYPDAVAFAVLLMNMAAPTIDYYTQPRVFGHQRGED